MGTQQKAETGERTATTVAMMMMTIIMMTVIMMTIIMMTSDSVADDNHDNQ